MNILVLNCGSSSLKAEVIQVPGNEKRSKFTVERIGTAQASLRNGDNASPISAPSHTEALQAILALVSHFEIHAVGHRAVHGGDIFDQPVLIDDTVIAHIEKLTPLAPLHTPANLAGIRAAQAALPHLPQVAVFDTAFHATLPTRARTYALPKQLTEKYGLRRYGFHGTSHAYVAAKAAEYLKQDLRSLRIITCHLGNGASVCAVEYGRSVETSMGMTPLEGLVMGTRSGDVDPGILVQLMVGEGWDAQRLDEMLNRESGLQGLSGVGNDMRDIIQRSTDGDEDARLALHVFCHRVRKYIGAYAAVMGGVDAIVFTGGIGENSPVVRHRCTQRLDFLGAMIDEDANRDGKPSDEAPVLDFSFPHSRAKLLAIQTDEEFEIARETFELVVENDKVNALPPIPIAISARHVHLTQESVEKLFGAGYQLTERNPLSQPGQFAANETVNLVGPKNVIQKVRILGPTRNLNQVEISRTDEFFLGIDAPVRESGKTENTPGITLEGPAGKLDLKDGLICAWRHIHMTPADALVFGVEDRDVVDVTVQNADRSLTFGNVLIRVSDKYKLEMHIDTDEGNAAEILPGNTGVLRATTEVGHLSRKKII